MQKFLTAITRNGLSRPMKQLVKSTSLQGRLLDYGCGKGFDARKLGIERYDPFYYPKKPKGRFDTITCIYVLNTIPEEKERLAVLDHVFRLLRKGGAAYFAVRRDIENLNGWTSRGTWQGFVKLDLPTHYRCRTFEIYVMRRTYDNPNR